MTQPPLIKSGGIADIGAVMEVMDAAFDPRFGEAWSRAQCLAILSLTDVWLTLGMPPGEPAPAGFALCRRMADEAELLLLAVRPADRGRGLGAALVEHCAAEARARGANRLLLEVRSSNSALALYAEAGFAEVGRRPAYYRGAGGALHDALTLARRLEN